MLNQLEQSICNNPNEDWNYSMLSSNSNIIAVQAIPNDDWNYYMLSSILFKYSKGLQYVKIKKIQRWYRSIKYLQIIHHISKLNQVNTELIYLPCIGYKFFELKTDFESLI
jgi:hypothetical protein